MLEDIFNISTNISNFKFIAEVGVHHNGSIDLAKKYIDEAKKSGADAVKFQTYKASTLVTRKATSYWDLEMNPIKSQHELFSKNDKFWKNEFIELKEYSDKADIEFLSTPFDFESAKFLNDLMNVFKISSSDLNNKPFIQYISDFNKPIFLSTGASTIEEIKSTISWLKLDNEICLLHCVLNYPTNDSDANLMRIKTLKNNFKNIPIGYSDHTLPNNLDVLVTSYLLGSSVIEKHFSLNKTEKGNDHFHSLDSNDLKEFKRRISKINKIIGNGGDNIHNQNISRINARRSCVSTRHINKNQIIQENMITFKRPGNGIEPKDLSKLIGKRAIVEIPDDTTITLEMIK